jgi:hypothetical protein
MAAGLRCGLDDKLYINSGNHGAPTWIECQLVQDLNLDLEKDKAEIKARLSRWVMTLPTHKKAPVSFKILGDTSDTNYATLRDAFINDTLCDVAIADGAIATSGTEYFRADFYLYGFKKAQPLGEANTADVTMDLAYSLNTPAFTTVGS